MIQQTDMQVHTYNSTDAMYNFNCCLVLCKISDCIMYGSSSVQVLLKQTTGQR